MYKLNYEDERAIIDILDNYGYNVIDVEVLIEYLERYRNTYIGTKEDIVDDFCNLMQIDFLPVMFLDTDTIIEHSEDWEALGWNSGYYLNTYRLLEDLEYEFEELECDERLILRTCIEEQ